MANPTAQFQVDEHYPIFGAPFIHTNVHINTYFVSLNNNYHRYSPPVSFKGHERSHSLVDLPAEPFSPFLLKYLSSCRTTRWFLHLFF